MFYIKRLPTCSYKCVSLCASSMLHLFPSLSPPPPDSTYGHFRWTLWSVSCVSSPQTMRSKFCGSLRRSASLLKAWRTKTASWCSSARSSGSCRRWPSWPSSATSLKACKCSRRWDIDTVVLILSASLVFLRHKATMLCWSWFVQLFALLQQLHAVIAASVSIKSSQKLKKILEVTECSVSGLSRILKYPWLPFWLLCLLCRLYWHLETTWTAAKEEQSMDSNCKV